MMATLKIIWKWREDMFF